METYTTTDLAEMFQVDAGTIRKEIKRGKLNCFYVGSIARFTQFHVDEYTNVRNFNKTTREIELEAEYERLLEVIKAKDEVLSDIRDSLLKGVIA